MQIYLHFVQTEIIVLDVPRWIIFRVNYVLSIVMCYLGTK